MSKTTAVKPKKQFIVKEDGSLLTPEFRVSFPKVFTPDENKKYGLCMIFDSDVDFSELEELVAAKIKQAWPKGAPKGLMTPILDGNDSQAGREELLDKFYVNAKANKYRPGVVGPDREPIEDENEFYPGCWARAVITVYNWTYMGKNGISVNVRNIQKLRDDEPLISRPKAEDEFGSVGTGEAAGL